jgi:hypothetical protein
MAIDGSQDEPSRRKYAAFVDAVVDSGGAWCLLSDLGPSETSIPTASDRSALPLWSTRALALEFAIIKGLTEQVELQFVPIIELIEEALPSAAAEHMWIHPDPQQQPCGLLLPPEGLEKNVRLVRESWR